MSRPLVISHDTALLDDLLRLPSDFKTQSAGSGRPVAGASEAEWRKRFAGAEKAIVDARLLAGQIKRYGATERSLQNYEAVRRPATAKVVLTNRSDPPDSILREVWQRSRGERFERIEDVISAAELKAISDNYKKVAGFDIDTLKSRPSFV